MASNDFDFNKWLNADRGKKAESRPSVAAPRTATDSLYEDLETVVSRLEEMHIDLTANYADWVAIGFALSDGLGESGRYYFHRISRFYPQYSPAEADKQYSQCLKDHRGEVSIRTFFQKAKDAGINISTRKFATLPVLPTVPTPNLDKNIPGDNVAKVANMANPEQLPTFSDLIETDLPDYLQRVASHGETYQDKDVLLLGAICTISACLPNVSGLYDGVEVYPNLFFFLTARASSGKGRLNLCRLLVLPIHERLFELYKLERQEYEMKKAEFDANRTSGIPKPEPPAKHLLFIPANSSATSVYQILGESDERGLIFETEGDTLAYSFSSDFGNFSDGFRKAFHHEPISYHRRKDDEHVDIKHPQLSTVLSGTPEQLKSLVKDAENGLFSRFIFYRLNSGLTWKNVFAAQEGRSLDEEFELLGHQFCDFYYRLSSSPNLRYRVTESQAQRFNSYFTELQETIYNQYGDNIIASVRRMGLIFYRISMILSTLRIMETGDYYSDLECADLDFETTLNIVQILIRHTTDVYEELCPPAEPPVMERNEIRTKLLEALPEQFDRNTFKETAAALNIPIRTADRYLAKMYQDGLLDRPTYGTYSKSPKLTTQK